MMHDETKDETRSDDMNSQEKVIRVTSLEDFDRRDGAGRR